MTQEKHSFVQGESILRFIDVSLKKRSYNLKFHC